MQSDTAGLSAIAGLLAKHGVTSYFPTTVTAPDDATLRALAALADAIELAAGDGDPAGRLAGARLIHISTDCVFAGTKGLYREQDTPDARDLYGLSKLLGEVDDEHAVTLRTSIIGPELEGAHGLLGWFLAQKGRVRGFSRAVFSGVPTVELARVIRDFVIPHPELRGVHHVSAAPINKYDLLVLFAKVYALEIEIEPNAELVIDRSLDSTAFRKLTGYVPPEWPQLVQAMRHFG